MTKIKERISDLQSTLHQQYSIYTTHQDLHFDWLQSVMFQLKVYDNNENENKSNITVHDKNQSQIDAEEISNNQILQQKNLLDSYKRQLRPNLSVITEFMPNIDEDDSTITLSPLTSSPLIPSFKNHNETKKTPIKSSSKEIHNNNGRKIPNTKDNNFNPNNKNSKNIHINKKVIPKSPVNLPLGRSFTSPKFIDSPTNNNNDNIGNNSSVVSFMLNSPSVKFVDNDSLLSTSQSSFGSDSGCDNSGDDSSINSSFSEYHQPDSPTVCQTLPSKITGYSTMPISSLTSIARNSPCTISGCFSELSQTATSFQAQWQEMVEEKKRSTLTPKIPGTLFEFDKIPDSYQITDSDDLEDGNEERFFSSSESDEELKDDSLFEVHGKMIPIWARKENVQKFLEKQQKMKPDEIFANMKKHCYVSQIFGVEKRPSLAAETTWDESDDCDELIVA